MNSTVYIFGSLGKGYTQYPDDYAMEIFQNFHAKATANSQIITHRVNELLYYGYVRKLDADLPQKDSDLQYIGFCVLLNGVMLSTAGELFPIFENAIERLIEGGEILGRNDKGMIVSHVDVFSDKQHEVERIANIIRESFSGLEKRAKKLPPVSYEVPDTDSKTYSLEDDNDAIIEAIAKYSYTCIHKDKDYKISYQWVINKIKEEKTWLVDKCAEQSEELDNLKRELFQTRRQRNVIMAFPLLLGIAVVVLVARLYLTEVTHCEMNEFSYYGPLNKEGKPNGIGVAIYFPDDEDERKYYVGNFVNGVRKDTAAILFYQHGDYFYGSIEDDEFKKGVMFIKSDSCYFIGNFMDDEPYDGDVYDCKWAYRLIEE